MSDDKGQNVEGQERELRAVAARMGLEVPEDFVFRMQDENAHSVFKGDPPEKKRVLELAKRRKFDVLMVWSLDRWSRRRKDGLREVFDILPAYGVSVFSHEESFLSTEGVPEFMRESIASTLLWLAEEDSKRKSRRVRVRYETNRNRAVAGGGKAKWGRGTIATPAEADAVRAMKLADPSLSIRKLAGQTGLPKSTVARILDGLSQTSRSEGGSAPSGTDARPNGTLGTAVVVQNSTPVVSGAPLAGTEPANNGAATGDGGSA